MNNTPDTVLIPQVILNDDPRPGVQWSLEDTAILPAKLAPGEVLHFTLCALIAKGDTVPLTGSLDIVQQTQCGQTDTATLPLHGTPAHLPPASVTEASSQPTGFTIAPNPASGEVTISLPSNVISAVEIYDVLGNLILSKQVSGEYVWNPETANAMSETYIVRVTERGTDGQFAVSSQRLLLLR
jgi:hypothetical protein